MSAAMLESPEVEVLEADPPRAKRWTRFEVLALQAQGFFANNRIMLLNGVIYKMPPAFPPHDVSLVLLCNYLQSIVPAKCYVRNQLGFGLSAKTDPAPDLAVVDGNIRDHEIDHPSSAHLIVEIADSSLALDLKRKMHLYAAGQVKEYWVVDLEHRKIIVHRERIRDEGVRYGFRFQSVSEHDANSNVAPLFAPQSPIKVENVLPRLRAPS